MKLKQACRLNDCDRDVLARGYCRKHYRRLKSEGMLKPITPEDRFWPRVDKSASCWLWSGTYFRDGYGQFPLKGRNVLAHRFSYELHYGPIADGLVIDHRCRNRACVRPEHLRAVTQKQNCENFGGANRNSQTGVLGVHWVPRRQRFRAQVGHNGKVHYVGEFRDLADAAAAVRARRLRLFTHNDADRS